MFHTNEGHAGFLGVERIGELVAQGLSFDEAKEAVRAGTVFTTHTPVPAGIDRFPRELIGRYFGSGPGDGAAVDGLPVERILELGDEADPGGLQHGAHGPAHGAAPQRRRAAARHRQPRHVLRAVAGLRRGRGADHAR